MINLSILTNDSNMYGLIITSKIIHNSTCVYSSIICIKSNNGYGAIKLCPSTCEFNNIDAN